MIVRCGAGKRQDQQAIGKMEVTPEGVSIDRDLPRDDTEAKYADGNQWKPMLWPVRVAVSLDSYNTETEPEPMEFWCPRHKLRWLTLEDARSAVRESRDAVCVAPNTTLVAEAD